MNKRLTRISKYLTYILRHEPGSIGLALDPDGYLNIDELVKNANAGGKSITAEQVHQVVAGHEDRLFSLSDDGSRIRVTTAQRDDS
ncbi:MAG: RNA 2'-phosphotransferase [Pirellulaceae bacterium]|nr:RNA 2'-phosphotransferase [Pirellulaceae bacterium]